MPDSEPLASTGHTESTDTAALSAPVEASASRSEPVPDDLPEKQQPFTFGAVAIKNLIRGELITFYVNAKGQISADKLDRGRAPVTYRGAPVVSTRAIR